MTINKGFSRKSIERELNKRLNAWFESIEDERIRKAAQADTIVTGGCIASMLLGEKINDVDVYFKTMETAKLVAKHYLDKMPAIVEIIEAENIRGETEQRVSIRIASSGLIASPSEESYQPIFISENAITLSNDIQIITRFYGDHKQIHKNFDFIHATCSYDYSEGLVTLPPEALEVIISRTLFYSGSLYPLASLFRLRKFLRRGWSANAGQILKIAFQISEIDFKNREVLREQLTGVDQQYMDMLISALVRIPPEKFNASYVSEVIDKIFGGDSEDPSDV